MVENDQTNRPGKWTRKVEVILLGHGANLKKVGVWD